MRELKVDDDSISGLLCQESETCLDDELVEDTFINFTTYDDCEDEYMDTLFEREICYGFKRNESLVFGNWIKRARLETITWILKIRAAFGFSFQTVHMSMTYFDRFLSRRSISSEKLWAIRLLSVACLSLAAKMEEVKVPVLSEYLLEDYNFDSKVIQRMELLVLSTLEWRMCSITPFAFLYFFLTKLCDIESPPSNMVSRTVEIMLALMREVNLTGHRPSAIAAASALLALDDRLTRRALEMKMNSISHRRFLEIDEVYSCYNMMRRLDMENLKIPKVVNSPNLSPTTQLRPIGRVVENSSVTTNKRRRLTFSACDQSCGIPDHDQLC